MSDPKPLAVLTLAYPRRGTGASLKVEMFDDPTAPGFVVTADIPDLDVENSAPAVKRIGATHAVGEELSKLLLHVAKELNRIGDMAQGIPPDDLSTVRSFVNGVRVHLDGKTN